MIMESLSQRPIKSIKRSGQKNMQRTSWDLMGQDLQTILTSILGQASWILNWQNEMEEFHLQR
jgi:hypothetical protein